MKETRSANFAISANGKPMKFVSRDAEAITVRTTLRLCPGRAVTCRLGDAPLRAVVLSSSVCTLGEDGAEYLVAMAFGSDAAAASGELTAASPDGELQC